MLKVNILQYPSDQDWLMVRNNALTTKRMNSTEVPSSKLKTKLLFSEHSPIRSLEYIWEWVDIPYWVSVHFVRHHEGITHFVSSQRNDIQKVYDRRKAPQDSLVNHRCVANAQAIMNIAKSRLCINASTETRFAWFQFLQALKDHSPEIVSLCVPPCVYRNGICPEVFKPCGYNKSNVFKSSLEIYTELIGGLY